MNAMIRALKGTLAVLALAGLGLLLRWMTAGSISGVRTYDLDTLTVLAVGTVAWIAYGWLALAVVTTVLEQLPGVVGALAGAVASRITTKTARALLRSGLGVAAVTPLTVGVAHATPGDTSHVLHLNQTAPAPKLPNTTHPATEPHSTIQLGTTNYRATEPHSRVEIGGSHTAPQQAADTNYRATEPRSTVEIGGTDTTSRTAADTNSRATEPRSTVEIGGTDTTSRTAADTNSRATEPRSTVEIGGTDARRAASQQAADADYRATEPRSKVEIGGAVAGQITPAGSADANYRATEPRSKVEIGGANTDYRAAEPPSEGRLSGSSDSRPASTSKPATELPTGGRMRVGVPDRPTDGAPTRYTELRATIPVRVVVRDGDSLWTLAARELGPKATNGAIAARWPDWYAANRQVIGDDPDLIFPGQVLRVPPASTGDHVPPTHQEK